MKANPPDRPAHRIAVILGSGRSSRSLLDLVLPLLGTHRDIEMQGVFLEEAEIQHAAELPFVKELCRVTFSVREFNSDQFERALTLRIRTARRALAVIARNAGVAHSFRNVRGSAISLLRETATGSDIMVFEPARMIAASMGHAVRPALQRIVVAVGDLDSGRKVLRAAAHLAAGRMHRLSVLLSPAAAAEENIMDHVSKELQPGKAARIRTIPGSTIRALVDAVHAEGASLLVIAATEELLEPGNLQMLRDQLRCPICLVRHWDNNHPKAINGKP